MRKVFVVLLVLAIAAVGMAMAAGQVSGTDRWKAINPCFDSTGKWYTIIMEDEA